MLKWLRFTGFDVLQQRVLRNAHDHPVRVIEADRDWQTRLAEAVVEQETEVVLGPGVFGVTGDLVIPDGMAVRGCGNATVLEWGADSTLTISGSAQLVNLKLAPPTTATPYAPVIVQNELSEVRNCDIDFGLSNGTWTTNGRTLIEGNRIIVGVGRAKVHTEALIQATSSGLRLLGNTARKLPAGTFGFATLVDGCVASGNECQYGAPAPFTAYGKIFIPSGWIMVPVLDNIADIGIY